MLGAPPEMPREAAAEWVRFVSAPSMLPSLDVENGRLHLARLTISKMADGNNKLAND